MFIDICFFIYIVGVAGAIIGVLDLKAHNHTSLRMRNGFILALIAVVPFLNHYLMWECLKEVESQKKVYKYSHRLEV